MYCIKCGKKIDEDSKFCSFCGYAFSQQTPDVLKTDEVEVIDDKVLESQESEVVINQVEDGTEEVEVEVPDEENLIETESSLEKLDTNMAQATEEDNQISDKPKRRINKKVLLISCLSVVLAAAIALVFTFPYVSNFVVKSFSSTDEYYHYVEKAAADDMAEDIVGLVSVYRDSLNKKQSTESNISFKLSPEMQTLLKNNDLPIEVVNMISDFSISSNVYGDLKLNQMDYSLKFGDNSPITAQTIIDSENEFTYLKLPEFSNKFLKINTDQAIDYDKFYKTVSALPQDETLEELIQSYSYVIVEELNNVKYSKENVEVEGITQSCSVYTVEITEDIFNKICVKVLEKAATDSSLEKVVKDIMLAIDPDCDADKKYKDFLDDINDSLDELYEKIENPSDSDEEDYLLLKTYVDSKGDIIGRSIGDDESSISYLNLINGKEFAYEIKFDTDEKPVSMVGTGEVDGRAVNGNFKVEQGKSVLLELKILNFKPFSEGDRATGRFELAFCENTTESLDLSADFGDFKLEDLMIAFDLDSGKTDGEMKMVVNYQNKEYLTIINSVKINDSKEVTLPKDSESYLYNGNNNKQWLNSINVTNLRTSLQKAGVPKEFVDLIVIYVQQSIDMANGKYPSYDYGGSIDGGIAYYG